MVQGWEGFRPFKVIKYEAVANSTRLLLEPLDGKEVCIPEQGQFVCLRVDVEGFGSIVQNTSIGALVKTLPDNHATSSQTPRLLRNSRSESDRLRESAITYEATLSRRGSKELGSVPIPAAAVETAVIVSSAIKEGTIVELSVPVGGRSHVDSNESTEPNRTPSKYGECSLLKTALLQKVKCQAPSDGVEKANDASAQRRGARKLETTREDDSRM
jgi:hypothetical protein